MAIAKNTICVWYDGDAEAAAQRLTVRYLAAASGAQSEAINCRPPMTEAACGRMLTIGAKGDRMRAWGIGAALMGGMLFVVGVASAQDGVVLPKEVNIAIQAYIDCIGSKAKEGMDSSDSSDVVFDRAIEACVYWRDLMRDELRRPPLCLSRMQSDNELTH